MYLIPFRLVEPELAADETRVMRLLVAQDELPAGQYAVLEHCCPDPHSDCRRMMFTVVRRGRLKRCRASISYAFDRDGPMPGPFIALRSPQTKHAEAVLALVTVRC